MFAQHRVLSPQNNQDIAGQYGSSDGVLLFENGRFALYGYATFVLGSYAITKNGIDFTPDVPPLFAVYGFHNPALGDGVQMMFQGFEEGGTYVMFDDEKPQPIFNQDANCFDWPFVYHRENKPHSITFNLNKDEYDDAFGDLTIDNHWQFANDQYNDFIFVFNKPTRYYLPFKGLLQETTEEVKFLQVSANFGDRLLPFTPKEEVNEWAEIVQMENRSDISAQDQEAVYANERYNMVGLESENYAWDENSNLLVDTLNTEEESEFRATTYHDTRFLKKYVSIKATRKTNLDISSLQPSTNSIFFTSCEESEKSYKNPYNQVEAEENTQLDTIPPIPVPDKK
ncbi:hypothetical protein DC487_15990 [Sphingobacterium corticibacter]|uniref:Uncharacterized protein n=2 Tax=Sphingobacterium corticibacter TaxID=2171749 RepID=A0A2T8HET4_9SPHI|nr:hypothetical protein DC487_15990 [Sphingobacterium corticibacter]